MFDIFLSGLSFKVFYPRLEIIFLCSIMKTRFRYYCGLIKALLQICDYPLGIFVG